MAPYRRSSLYGRGIVNFADMYFRLFFSLRMRQEYLVYPAERTGALLNLCGSVSCFLPGRNGYVEQLDLYKASLVPKSANDKKGILTSENHYMS